LLRSGEATIRPLPLEKLPSKKLRSKKPPRRMPTEERAKLAHAEGLDTFQRAFAACMDARNYSVK
jgi:hypothetical protein